MQDRMITSVQNPKVKRVRSLLADRSARKEEGAFVLEGVRLVDEALNAGWLPSFVYFSEKLSQRGMEIIKKLSSQGCEVEEVSSHVLEAMTETQTPQGILGVFPIPEESLPTKLDFVLILDELKDPGNLGTVLRTAAVAGTNAIILTPGTVDAFAPKVIRSAMGAHFYIPILELTWEQIVNASNVNELKLILADLREGLPYWKVNFKEPIGLVIGSEAQGAGIEAHKAATERVTIPMPGKGESLNASVAAGILLFEVVRQRNNPNG